MTQEEKELLLKDLCARLPYGVHCCVYNMNGSLRSKDDVIHYCADVNVITYNSFEDECFMLWQIKPYLRPMSSMPEEEKEELLNLLFDKEAKYFYIDEEGFIDGKTSDLMKEGFNYPSFCPINIELYTDFLLSHHFDYRGLIEKGLALEAPEGMYNY